MSGHAHRLLLAATCAALLPWGAAEASAGTAADRELQALKAEAVELGREIEMAERARRYPGGTLTSVYVAVRVSGFLLESATVRIDSAAHRHAYDGSEALALLKDGGWHRLARLSLPPGRYRLQAEFSGRFHDARDTDPPIRGQVEAEIEKGAGELDIVLPIARAARPEGAASAELAFSRQLRPPRTAALQAPERIEIVPGSEAAGGPDDPRYRAALFLKGDYRFFSALVELATLQQAAGRGDALPASFSQLLAECYLGFGMGSLAATQYQRLQAASPDAAVVARAQLQLAQFDGQHGRHAEAVERLRAVRERLPGSLRNEWRVLMTNALLARQQHDEAAALLEAEGLGSTTPALRYNLAVALVGAGKTAEGRARLDEVGTMPVSNLEQLVLRDKANLALGYQYLQEQRGAAARKAFARVRTRGPFSNRALLGLGWAEVAREPDEAPSAAAATAAGDDTLDTLLRPGPAAAGAQLGLEAGTPSPSSLPPAEQDALRRALVAWVELTKRDPMDPAVQEGMLAIAWALDRLQAYEQSLTHYLKATAALETARARMDQAIVSVRGRVMVGSIVRSDADSERGWQWKVRNLPNVPETSFLQSLLAEHRFQEPLKLLRDARMLGGRVEAWQKRLGVLEATGPGERLAALRTRVEALGPRLAAIAAAQDRALEQISVRELEGQRATIERYLTEARFAVARIYDRRQQREAGP